MFKYSLYVLKTVTHQLVCPRYRQTLRSSNERQAAMPTAPTNSPIAKWADITVWLMVSDQILRSCTAVTFGISRSFSFTVSYFTPVGVPNGRAGYK